METLRHAEVPAERRWVLTGVDLGRYDRLFKAVKSLWFMVSGNENPSVFEMKYNNVDTVISAGVVLSE